MTEKFIDQLKISVYNCVVSVVTVFIVLVDDSDTLQLFDSGDGLLEFC